MKLEEEQQSQPFAIVPTEVMMDTRLTLEAMRVLVTLFSFRNKLTGLAFPSREAISGRCGMHPSNISAATTKLVELGWLVKDGAGGYSKATKYTITIPEVVAELAALHRAKSEARKGKKVAEQATVAQSATVAEQAIQTVAHSATRQVAQSAIRIEQTNITDQLTVDSFSPTEKPKATVSDLQSEKNKRSTYFPKDFEVTEEMFDWAVSLGIKPESVKPTTLHFKDHHEANGNKFTNWNAAWRNWMRNSVKFARTM